MGLAVALGLVGLAGLRANVFHGYRLQLTDVLFPTGETDERVAVVAIDRRSLADVGLPWPWPRSIHAELIRQLDRLGAEVIAFDVVFHPATAEDGALAAAAREAGNVVFGTLTEFVAREGRVLRAEVTFPADQIADAAAGVGHTSVTPDPADGVVRSMPLLVETRGGDLHPALALAAVMGAEGDAHAFTFRPGGLQVGERFITTGPSSSLDIAYSPELQVGAPGAPVLSIVDVLRGDVDRRAVEGKVVLIGVTDPSLGDDRPTPVAKATEMSGVMIHANVINTILTEHYLRPAGDARTAAAVAALALAVALVTLLAPIWLAPVGVAGSAAGYVVWTFVRFEAGQVLDLLYPLMFAVLALVGALAFRYVTELRGRRRAAALFSQYVPRSVAYQLLDEGRMDEAVGGERLDVTVLFCDLRGFTAQSVRMEPAQVRDMLNVFYGETTSLVHEHGGTLLNWVGDEVFAVWGAPMPDPRGADNAVACARAFQDACPEISRRLGDAGLPAVAFGIGLHTGEAVAAHVGTEMRRQYTVLGDTVNVASRLCTIAGRNEIVVSDDTYRRLGNQPPSEVLPGFRLKGVGRELLPRRLWPDELRDPTGEVRAGKVET